MTNKRSKAFNEAEADKAFNEALNVAHANVRDARAAAAAKVEPNPSKVFYKDETEADKALTAAIDATSVYHAHETARIEAAAAEAFIISFTKASEDFLRGVMAAKKDIVNKKPKDHSLSAGGEDEDADAKVEPDWANSPKMEAEAKMKGKTISESTKYICPKAEMCKITCPHDRPHKHRGELCERVTFGDGFPCNVPVCPACVEDEAEAKNKAKDEALAAYMTFSRAVKDLGVAQIAYSAAHEAATAAHAEAEKKAAKVANI